MKKNMLRLLMLFMCFFLMIPPGFAEQTTFEIGVENIRYYPHYTYENDKYGGYGREVLDAFAQSKGYTFIYKALPVKRLFRDLVNDLIDFKYPDNAYWSADIKEGKIIYYSNPVTRYIEGVVVLPERKGEGLEHVKTLGTVMGFTAWEYLKYFNSGQIALKENKSSLALLTQVIRGRIDGAYTEIAVAQYQLESVLKQPGVLVFDSTLPHMQDFYYFSTTKHPDIIEEFNEFLQDEHEFIIQLQQQYKLYPEDE